LLDKYPESVLTVTGHTDLVGTKDYNQDLGLKRAQLIQKYLEEKGILSTRIITSSKGKDQPLGDYLTEEGRAKNRRTEISIKK
jgi:outer membrane protein OmpA-like peptidoglycan-associated protein